MATQTQPRSTSRSKKSVSPPAPVDATMPIARRLNSAGKSITSILPNLGVSSQVQREALAVVMILLALFSGWVLWSTNDQGRLVGWWSWMLGAAFGRAAFLVPILLALGAYRLLVAGDERALLPRHYAGAALIIAAAVGLIELAAQSGQAGSGGRLGKLTGALVSELVGPVGGGVILFVAGSAGVFLMTGTGIRTFISDLRALVPSRPLLPDFEFDEIPEAAPPIPDAVLAPEKPAKPTQRELAKFSEAITPVINVPHSDKAPSSPKGDRRPAAAVKGAPMTLPEVARLALYEDIKLDETDLTTKALRIEETLASFKVDARVREINPGPAVTQYTLEPGTGIKVRRITELQNDLALALAAPSIRIEAPVPGMARVGIEIPNAKVATVGLRETLEADTFAKAKFKLPIPLGRDVHGRYVIHDLTKMPHLLIAGATGSGKSVCLTSIISTFLISKEPDELKMLMIDPKMVELTGYNGVPHLTCPVVTEMDKVVSALRLVLQEMERRYTLFSKLGVRNLDGYRMKIADEPNAEKIPYFIVIIDELADLMMTSPDDVEGVLCRLAQMGRASGIHLILATQRPSVDVLTGLIKANVPARVAFAVTSLTDSRVVLDLPGAERLLGRGDMLFLPPDAAKPVRIQGAFIEDKDVNYIVDHWHAITPIPQYAEEWLNLQSSSQVSFDEDGDEDPLMEQAREVVRQQGTASASMLQRRLRIGYNRAARIIEHMEDEGMIGPADGIKGRPVLAGDY